MSDQCLTSCLARAWAPQLHLGLPIKLGIIWCYQPSCVHAMRQQIPHVSQGSSIEVLSLGTGAEVLLAALLFVVAALAAAVVILLL